MKNYISILATSILSILLMVACSKDYGGDSYGLFADGAGETSNIGGEGNQTGRITAGEWNDLEHWNFWLNLMNDDSYSEMPDHWKFYNEHRISVKLTNNNIPVIDARLELIRNNKTVWVSKTDNFGTAELWPHLFEHKASLSIEDYVLRINGTSIDQPLILFKEGINEINLPGSVHQSQKLELCFIVDATGSMSDELEFLKDDLEDVIQRVENENSGLEILTSSVFYRDVDDKYVVRSSEFTSKLSKTLGFIDDQKADGGGDFPEAVHSALLEAIDELQWSENTLSRIAFLLLDAPPHHETEVIEDLQHAIASAAQKGIKIIPITASGIDKETEFLMRFFALSTNATYVFITNHSGIGNDHLEASVGDYEVEYLNDLMVRLINKYVD
jgi:hypothetical protein